MKQLQLFDTTDPAEEGAKTLIRAYVKRGDSAKDIREGYLGHAGTDYCASIGGFMVSQWHGSNKILVERVQEQEVNQVFDFQTIYNAVKAE